MTHDQRPTRVKILATIGPASDSPTMVSRLIEAGVAAFRLNFSHGALADHARRLAVIRAEADRLHRVVAIVGDLCGPKIRLGRVDPPIVVETGQDVALVGGESAAPGVLTVTYLRLADEVRPGHRVLFADGAVRMLAVERREVAARPALICRVTQGGPLSSGKGVNLPDSVLSVPAITERDWECVEWAVQHGLDYLALSFVRRADEVRELKHRLFGMCPVDRTQAESDGPSTGSLIQVIAKIEKPEAVAELERIIEAADAVMVARGDLGVEMDLAQVPVVQKRIVAMAADWGRPCIVATQMLESMIDSASPTRAEVSDVANAVFDGADAVMLSGETAVGKYPALAVDIMRRVIDAAEARIASLPHTESPPKRLVESKYPTAALAHGAWHIARDIGARAVVCWSQAGGTARYLSQNDFRIPILALTTNPHAARRMALLRGVTPVVATAPPGGRLGAFTDLAERMVLQRGWVERGDPVLLLAGKPLGTPKATNSIATLFVGDPTGGYRAHSS
ncbi:MAG: pyruvate kinase [Phycisphaerales bacterium]